MPERVNRRRALALGAAAAGMAAAPAPFAAALAANDAVELMRRFAGGRRPVESKVSLDLPDIAPDGNMVPMTVAVASPMTAESYVSDVLVVADDNPQGAVVAFRFSPQSGVAEASIRIRLARSQTVTALARMSDGAVHLASQRVEVTVGGCGADS